VTYWGAVVPRGKNKHTSLERATTTDSVSHELVVAANIKFVRLEIYK
jgi:hypothetical protein